MRVLLTIIGICAVAGAAFASKEEAEPIYSVLHGPCNFVSVCFTWDFSTDPQGFTAPNPCDPDPLCEPTWEWGTETLIPPPQCTAGPNVWGTTIGGNYPYGRSGDRLLSPPFDVVDPCVMMEICHYVHIETNFDGGNVVVIETSGAETIVPPLNGYPSVAYPYACCVPDEPVFTGNGYAGPSVVWGYECFDLSAWAGQTIQVGFDFGSDSSVNYPGWYLAYVSIGSLTAVPTEGSSWSSIKSLYR